MYEGHLSSLYPDIREIILIDNRYIFDTKNFNKMHIPNLVKIILLGDYVIFKVLELYIYLLEDTYPTVSNLSI